MSERRSQRLRCEFQGISLSLSHLASPFFRAVIVPGEACFFSEVTVFIGDQGLIDLAWLECCFEQCFQVAAALKDLCEVDAVGQGAVCCPDRDAMCQCESSDGGSTLQAQCFRPGDVFHGADPGFIGGQCGKDAGAEPLLIEGGVMGDVGVGLRSKLHEVRDTGLGFWSEGGDGGRDIVDVLSGVSQAGQDKGELTDYLPEWDAEQDGADFNAVGVFRLQACGFGVKYEDGVDVAHQWCTLVVVTPM